MAMNPAYLYSETRVDRSGEKATFSFNIPAAELEEAGVSAELGAVQAGIEGLINGTKVSYRESKNVKVSNVAFSTTGQREDKWLITYEDTTTHALYQTELPCRDNSITVPTNTDELDISTGAAATLKTAWDAYVLSPDGNATAITSIRLIGRNV